MVAAIEADYVVVGAGAMGMAFVDEILTHSDASVAIVDQHAKPGGHWNDAYPFVRLHQPSFFYGVSSAELGGDRIDEVGLNAGLSELASGAEVTAYFDQVMHRRFLPSGRVEYLPRATYRDGAARVAPANLTVSVTARRAVVDATYMKVKVPSTTPPAYAVESDANVIPPNQLPTTEWPAGGFNVIGAGKTAFDAILWLLANRVDPSDIQWVVPRDSWLLNRSIIQPGDGLRIGEQTGFAAEAGSADELFERLEAEGHFLRIDRAVEPTMYRCATVTEAELEQLRRIERVERGSRVVRVTASTVELTDGALTCRPGTVHVDCTADGLERLPARPVFEDGRITLQTVRACQQVFSAGFIGRVETLEDTSLDIKNELATVVPHPDAPVDYLTGTLAQIHNVGRWMARPEIADWLEDSRLSPTGGRAPDLAVAIQAVENLTRFVDEATV
ncbi:MAG: NAD(P)/FAD-dependent oxidoreductase [Actinomycetota bacterium]